MVRDTDTGAAVCNPWLKQITWINETRFKFHGIGYPHTNSKCEKRVYKTIWCNYTKWKIHDLASGTWKYVVSKSGDTNNEKNQIALSHSLSGVLMNVNLFWIISFDETKFCAVPCRKRHPLDVLVLRVFKGERFSVLKQSKVTNKIEIWVTMNKVSNERLVVCCCDKTGKPWIYVMGIIS
ncbi:hypothetical protein IGI04_009187 [Brassica rapa subsp. trilocularis]|uniref:F-box associated beta-propeller type 1 domain-containing protein n=1 Tax=Brassica rapa subsp. trilocularis TaxID=1813537 RepID=A0ABQ7MWJ1_BRACM|nr:hypothetical protein IGI04_009187 [Brassica rapa subsp. trilocularis]